MEELASGRMQLFRLASGKEGGKGTRETSSTPSQDSTVMELSSGPRTSVSQRNRGRCPHLTRHKKRGLYSGGADGRAETGTGEERGQGTARLGASCQGHHSVSVMPVMVCSSTTGSCLCRDVPHVPLLRIGRGCLVSLKLLIHVTVMV